MQIEEKGSIFCKVSSWGLFTLNKSVFFDLYRYSVWTLNWILYELIWKRCRFRFRCCAKINEPLPVEHGVSDHGREEQGQDARHPLDAGEPAAVRSGQHGDPEVRVGEPPPGGRREQRPEHRDVLPPGHRDQPVYLSVTLLDRQPLPAHKDVPAECRQTWGGSCKPQLEVEFLGWVWLRITSEFLTATSPKHKN